MKSDMILILVVLFFLLGCSFNCQGMKEGFSDEKDIAMNLGSEEVIASCGICVMNKMEEKQFREPLCKDVKNKDKNGYVQKMTEACEKPCEKMPWNIDQISSAIENQLQASCEYN